MKTQLNMYQLEAFQLALFKKKNCEISKKTNLKLLLL